MDESNRSLTAEIVAIGDELTSGARLDTNSQWLSRRLGELGAQVAYHSTVGDSLANNIDVFKTAAERADIVVATGGLGPTRDDLTREVLAAVAGTTLELNESALEHIQALFARRQREMPERNRTQAMFPAGSQQIFNPQGTAPGVDLKLPESNSRIFALPGVPAEMKRMFDETVAPRISLVTGGSEPVIQHAVMKFFGTGESDMERRLGDMIARDRQPRVGITVSQATISLRITAIGATQADCDQQIRETRDEIMTRVGDLHFGDGESFEQYHAIDQMLREREQSILIIEIGYAAPMANWFASLGETKTVAGSISFPTLEALYQHTGESSLETAIECSRKQFGADWLLMVNGYPNLIGADNQSGIPTAEFQIVVVRPDGDQDVTDESLGGHPAILQPRIAKAAMHTFRRALAENG